ncbi:MAG: glycosyltransferase family 61 protein [Chloroflexi bacterium]|nr:glycosyltransferase family 61 protein [Chloroflexota bacterium]
MIHTIQRVRRGLQRRWAERPYRRFQRLPEVSIYDLGGDSRVPTAVFAPPEAVDIPHTLTVGPVPEELTRAGGTTRDVPEQIAVVLPDAEIAGQYAVAVWDGRRIRESALLSRKSAVNWAWPAGTAHREPLELDLAAPLCSPGSGDVYFVWMVYGALRILAIRALAEGLGQMPKLLVPSNPARFVAETLDLLGVAPDDVIRWQHARGRVRRLVVTSETRWGPTFAPATCRWFREAMVNAAGAPTADQPRRLYISRGKARRRRIRNEDAVTALLAPLGFEAFTLEDLPVAEQVRLFAGAEAVVAPHGSGLTNLVFGQRIKVIELHTPAKYTNSFLALSHACGHAYAAWMAPAPDLDYDIDLDALRKLLALHELY